MDDTIYRQAAIKLAIDLDYESRGILKESKCREIENRYNMIPPAQPERKKGKWIHLDDDAIMTDTCKCSVCKKEFTVDAYRLCDIGFVVEDLRFCPNCGSDMREGI